MSENAVKLSLAREEENELRHGLGVTIHDGMSASVLITTGMDFEQQQ
jgi:hypothetical protein